jgi:NADH dehydrogenase/NADH:ubiquinone oxidoreductase subunit G
MRCRIIAEYGQNERQADQMFSSGGAGDSHAIVDRCVMCTRCVASRESAAPAS